MCSRISSRLFSFSPFRVYIAWRFLSSHFQQFVNIRRMSKSFVCLFVCFVFFYFKKISKFSNEFRLDQNENVVFSFDLWSSEICFLKKKEDCSFFESKSILTRLSCLWQLWIVSRGLNKNKICMNSCQNSLIQVDFFSSNDREESDRFLSFIVVKLLFSLLFFISEINLFCVKKNLVSKETHDAYTSFEVNNKD